MTVKEIREALDAIDVSTARGRAKSNGRAISLAPKDSEIAKNAIQRRDMSLSMTKIPREAVEDNCIGITEDELEMVEFTREMLLTVYAKADDIVRSKNC